MLLHTQKSLDKLAWNEVRAIHTSLGLKATATTRTRRDYQRRIVEAMPQPVAEPGQIATPLTCATCPLARHIDGDRYCCGLTDTVTRSHWEAKTDCYDAVASETESLTAQPEETPAAPAPIAYQEIVTAQPNLHQVTAQSALKTFNHPFRYRADIFNGRHSFSSATYGLCECDRCVPVAQPTVTVLVTPGTVATTTEDAPPNRGDNGRGRVTSSLSVPTATIGVRTPKQNDNFMTAFTKESEGDRKFNDLAYLSQLEMQAQLAIERTVIGSEEEAIAYAHLQRIEADIKYYGQPKPEPQPSLVIKQFENQMKELKADVLSLFKITAFDPTILPVCDDDKSEQQLTQSEPEPEGTIHWHSPAAGTIVGKKGALRNFYLRKRNVLVDLDMSNPATYEIMVVISADFTAAEYKAPNVHHPRIRAAIETGRTFNPKAFKDSPQFLIETENYCGIGRIMQGQDGRWWAWADGGVTGQPFPYENLATQYLERIAAGKQAQKQTPCIK